MILTLAYLSIQIRGSNRVAKAQSRQSMTEFAMGITRFRAENADRYAKIASTEALTAGDREFLYWSHMQMITYGEAYFQQHQLGLMSEEHWQGFSNWIDAYLESPGFVEFWQSDSASFSQDYSNWIEEKLDK